MSRVRGLIPWLRARRAGWSTDTDRAFHDDLFASHDHDAFSPAYTGNITVRRFADLAAPHIEGCGRVADVGCGLGEITCELARRFPDTGFFGVDHSRAGIDGARNNAERLGLDNVAFEVADMETFEPDGTVDIVTMFDAFHHLLDPPAFLARLGRHTRRFLLIEPQGDWKGSWLRDLDADWLAGDLENIRSRFAHVIGEASAPPTRPLAADTGSAEGNTGGGGRTSGAGATGATGSAGGAGGARSGGGAGSDGSDAGAVDLAGEPVENRYSIEAFEAMFAGYGLTVRGTVSGLDEYPPNPTLDTPTRHTFGEIGYQLYAALDEQLYEAGIDLYAKHLMIYAEAGAATVRRTASRELPAPVSGSRVCGPYDVEYLGFEGPDDVAAGKQVSANLRLRNTSFRVLSSQAPENPDLVSYHWLDRAGVPVVFDGERSPLPHDLAAGEEAEVSMRIVAPDRPGDYVLAVDLVQEGKSWFSDAGTATLDVTIRVRG